VQFLIIIAFGMIMLTDQFESPMIFAPGLPGAFAIIASIFALQMVVIRAGRKKIFHDLEGGKLPLAAVQNSYMRSQNILRIFALIGQTLLIFGTQWPELVRQTVGTHLAGLDELIMVLPFMLWLIAGYFFIYPADRAIRETMVGQMLAISEPVHPVWTRWQYVDFQMRFQVLLIGAPLFLIVMAKDIVDIPAIKDHLVDFAQPILSQFGLGKFAAMTPEGALAVAAGCVFLFSPFLIKIIWKTKPLPAGELRDALMRSAQNANLKYRDILLWPTYGVIVNAAVVGFAGPMRYIMLSDGLIESLTDGQIEGVFGHEVGHVKLHHLPYLLFFAMASMGLIGLAGIELQMAFQLGDDLTQLIVLGAVMVVWYFAFGFVSRRFEAQADLFGAKLLSEEFDHNGCAYQNCLRHQPYTLTLTGERPLCIAGAELFSSALDRTAGLNAIPRKAKSWRHGSIFNRCTFVVRAAEHLPTLMSFQWQVRCIKIVLIVALVITAIWGIDLLARLNNLPTVQHLPG
jgi:Zn-dependent protease with chaperone function